MTLYHYCPTHALAGIVKSGLTKGMLPWNEEKCIDPKTRQRYLRNGFRENFQWLTENSDWEQVWARPLAAQPFRKDEYRLTISIPAHLAKHLHRWVHIDEKHHPDSRVYINSFADARFWWLFHGQIPPNWIIATDRNPILFALEDYLPPQE